MRWTRPGAVVPDPVTGLAKLRGRLDAPPGSRLEVEGARVVELRGTGEFELEIAATQGSVPLLIRLLDADGNGLAAERYILRFNRSLGKTPVFRSGWSWAIGLGAGRWDLTQTSLVSPGPLTQVWLSAWARHRWAGRTWELSARASGAALTGAYVGETSPRPLEVDGAFEYRGGGPGGTWRPRAGALLGYRTMLGQGGIYGYQNLAGAGPRVGIGWGMSTNWSLDLGGSALFTTALQGRELGGVLGLERTDSRGSWALVGEYRTIKLVDRTAEVIQKILLVHIVRSF